MIMTETISITTPVQSPLQKSSADFMELYNQTIPVGFPRVTEALLKKFRNEHPPLFKEGELWSMDKHRKEVVDWFQIL